MCIRDRARLEKGENIDSISSKEKIQALETGPVNKLQPTAGSMRLTNFIMTHKVGEVSDCLLYTSDAADERSSVDLGGRRIIKKKNKYKKKKKKKKKQKTKTRQCDLDKTELDSDDEVTKERTKKTKTQT